MQEFNIDAFSDFIKDVLFDRLTIEDYILVIDELFDTRPKNTSGKFISFKSICHNIDFYKSGYNLALNTDNMIFTCYSHCGSFDLLELLVKRYELIGEPKSRYKCMQLICKTCGIPFEFADTEEKPIEYDWKKELLKYSKKNKKRVDKQEIKVYNDDVLEYFKGTYSQAWVDYGISKETMDKFEIGYYPYRSQITIPVRDRLGNLRGIRVRNMDERLIKEGCPRYMPLQMLDSTTFKFSTNSVLYGEYQNEQNIIKNKEIWLVESEKTCMKFDTWSNGNSNALAMMGSAISDDNIKYILSLNPRKIILMVDSDFKEYGDAEFEEFEKKVMKLANRFSPYVVVECLYNNLGYDAYKFSPTDYTKEQFKKLWKSKERLN